MGDTILKAFPLIIDETVCLLHVSLLPGPSKADPDLVTELVKGVVDAVRPPEEGQGPEEAEALECDETEEEKEEAHLGRGRTVVLEERGR